MTLRYAKLTKAMKLLLFTAFMVTGSVMAQEEDIDYSEMSLEDLLNVEVVTASKQAESIEDAPSVITVITKREIEQFGSKSLWEIYEKVVGIQPIFSAANGYNHVQFRGDRSSFPNHVLTLINGRPVYESLVYDPGLALNKTFPVSTIERIEIVRGPGSVLYGTSAFTGVINIITKTSEESEFTIEASAGSYSSKAGQIYGSYASGDLQWTIGVNFQEDDGWDYEFIDANGDFYSRKQYEENFGLFTSLKYKNFTASLMTVESEQGIYDFDPASVEPVFEQTQIDLGYEHKFSENWTLKSNITYNIHAEDRNWEPLIEFESDDYTIEANLFGSINDKTNVLFGAAYNILKGSGDQGPYVIVDEWDTTFYSAYAQVDYRPTEKVKLIAGGQFNKPKETSGAFVPRAGAIFDFTESSGLKVLYGEAFRSGASLERFINLPGFARGNADMDPEVISTFDIQYFLKTEHTQFALTYFNSSQEDLIAFVDNTDADAAEYPFVYNNAGGLDSSGFELEFKYIPNTHWFLQGGLATQENEDDQGNDDVSLTPSLIAKFGLGYNSGIISAGLFNSYIDSYEIAQGANPDGDAVNIMSLNVAFNFNKFSIQLLGQNLLDEDLRVPDIVYGSVNSLPGYAETSFLGTVKARF